MAEGRDASDVLQQLAAERAVQDLRDWHGRRSEAGPEWVEPTDVSTGLLYLTADELTDLRAELDALIKPLAARRQIGQHVDRPADAEPVSFLIMTVPVPRTEHGG